jgi:hypothetical protein
MGLLEVVGLGRRSLGYKISLPSVKQRHSANNLFVEWPPGITYKEVSLPSVNSGHSI